jgi:hypothetical protein
MRQSIVVVLAALASTGVGCAPTIPFHMTETAAVLVKKQVAITLAGGGGAGSDTNHLDDHLPDCCGGGSLRLRVGVGHDQEVGAEVSVIGRGGGDAAIYPAGKLRYKLGLGRHLAFVAGVGLSSYVNLDKQASTSDKTVVWAGADVGLVASTNRLGGIAQLYGGARFTFVVPTSSPFYQNLPTQGFVVPVGVALTLSPSWQLFFEAGLLAGFSETASDKHIGWLGGYGAAALQVTIPST